MQLNSTNNSILFTTKNLLDKSNLPSSTICIASDNSKGTFSESTSLLTSYGRKHSDFFHDSTLFRGESPGSSLHNTETLDFTQLNIKKEPLKPTEVSTSNLLGSDQQNKSGYLPVQPGVSTDDRIFARNDSMDNQHTPLPQHSGISGIPIGIAFARQRLQEHSNISQPTKETNRFGVGHGGIEDGTFSVAPNILLADDSSSIIPSNADNHIFGLSNIRPTNSFWQYPIAIHESILPMSVPPIGFQIVRDPSTGNCICLPSTANNIDPFHPTLMWPTLTQTPSTTQVPHFMYPSVPQSLQAAAFPPFQWMGTDYLSSTTLHQHTQTQTRLVAVPTEAKRKVNVGARIENQIYNHVPIKLEDRNELQIECNTSAMSSNFQSNTYSENKISTNSLSLRNIKETITTGVHTKNTSFNSFEKFSNNSILENPEPTKTDSIVQPSTSTLVAIQSNNPVISNDVLQIEGKNTRNSINSECDLCICIANKQDAIIQTDTVCSEDIQNIETENDFNSCGNDERIATTVFHPQYFDNDETKVCPIPQINNMSSNNLTTDHENEYAKPSSKHNNFDNIVEENTEQASDAKTAPVDLSGLELLSNISIEAFENNEINLKQEIVEATSINLAMNVERAGQEPVILETIQVQKNIKEESKLEGLNLLCALAEQRIHEESDTNEKSAQEVDQRSNKCKLVTRKRTFKKIKKHKLSSKRVLLNEDYSHLNKEINEMLTQVKSNYDCGNNDGIQKNWPTPEQLIKAMEVNMRNRLAVISRKFQEKKKELEKITKKSYLKKKYNETSTESFPCSLDSNSTTSTSFQHSFILKSENMFQNLNVNSPNTLNEQDSKRAPPIELGKSNLFCNKKDNDINPTVSKNIVERGIGTNEPFQNIELDISSSNSPQQQQSSCKFQLAKTDLINNEDKLVVRLRKNSPDMFFTNDENNKEYSKNKCIRKLMKRHPTFKKFKKKRKSENCEKKQKNMDNILKISKDSLDQHKSRVLTAMGGLFYAGYLQPLEPPDVYSVTLDGERGNKPHIMCREEVLRDVILEVIPSSAKKVPPGTRICAYWSPQYRCLYPGTVVRPVDISNDNQYVSVEFDDGDSGKIVLEDIRFLLSDYPIAEYNINPLALLGKRKNNDLDTGNMDIVHKTDEYHVNNNERCKHNKIRRDRYSVDSFQQNVNLKHSRQHSDDYCKHKKHKKKKKHKRHHRKKPLENKQKKSDIYKTVCSETNIKQKSPMWVENPANLGLNKANNMEEIGDSSNSLSTITNVVSPEKTENKIAKKNSDNRKSKIAAFLPEKQLWGWLGTGVRRTGAKGRAKKMCYKTIQRGKETITIGESAVFLSTGRPDRPYIGKIQSMWETPSSNKVVRVKWFYHPEETVGCPKLKFPGALFESPHEDENDVQTISHKCEVLPLKEYTEKFGLDPKQYETIYFNNDTYYYAGFYDPTIQSMKLEQNIPTSDN